MADILKEFSWLNEEHDASLIGSGRPFSVNGAINAKIFLYFGEGWKLPVDTLVLGQNESLLERIDGNEAVFDIAGPVFDEKCAAIEKVFTGSAEVVEGGNLGQSHIIFAVGPKYDKNYVEASTSALHTAYRGALSLAVEKRLKTVALHCIYLQNKKYPRWDAAHVALRTLRRFLENSNGGAGDRLKKIILCVLTKDDLEIYNTLLPAYFPRTLQEEEEQVGHLPEGGADIGNEWGTIVYEDRQLRVAAGPGSTARDYMNTMKSNTSSRNNGHNSPPPQATPAPPPAQPKSPVLVPPINPNSIFATRKFTGNGMIPAMWPKPPGMTSVTSDSTARRSILSRQEPAVDEADETERLRKQYDGWLAELKAWEESKSKNNKDSRSQQMDYAADPLSFDAINISPANSNKQLTRELLEMEQLGFIQLAGKDMKARQVVMITAGNLAVPSIDMKLVSMYVMKVMEPLRCVPYVVVYCTAGISDDSAPALRWTNSILTLLSIRYKESLQQIYLLHAGVWMRMYIWSGLPMLGKSFWKDYIVCSNLLELDQYMMVKVMVVTQHTMEYDRFHFSTEHQKIFGYYN